MLVVSAIELIKCRTAKVHRTYRVTHEGMDTGIAGLSIAGSLTKVQVLGGKHSL